MFSKSKKSKGRQSDPASPSENLPLGAEAALWSIVEVMPDPRNHLALTRDPTAEVRVTRSAIEAAMALAAPPANQPEAPPAIQAEAPPVAAPGASWLPSELPELPDPVPAMPTARRHQVRWSSDTAEVRLPAFTAPQPSDAGATTATPADADVHSLEQPKITLPVHRRYARGA